MFVSLNLGSAMCCLFCFFFFYLQLYIVKAYFQSIGMIEYSLHHVDLSLSNYSRISELVYKFVIARMVTSISVIRGCWAGININACGVFYLCSYCHR